MHPLRATITLLSALSASCASLPAATVTVEHPTPGWLVALAPYGDEPQLALGEGQRFVLSNDRWRALPDAMDSAIVAAARVGDRWLFASESGIVARSARVDGPLVHVTQIQARLRRAFWNGGHGTPGRSIAVDDGSAALSIGLLPLMVSPARREILLVDGDGATRAARFEHAPISAVFASPTHGAALLESGELYCTADGGRAWRRVGPDNDSMSSLAREGATIVARGRHTYELDARCDALHPRVGVSFAAGHQSATLRALVQAEAERDPSAIGQRFQRSNHRVAAVDRTLIVLDERLGRVTRFEPDALPADGCMARPFGASMAIVCATHGRDARWWAAVLDGPTSPLRVISGGGVRQRRSSTTLVESAQRVVIDAAGRWILFAARCDETRDDTDEHRWCRIDAGGARAELRLSVATVDAEGISANLLLGYRATSPLRRSDGPFLRALVAHDVTTGAEVTLDPRLTAASTRVAIAADATVYAVSSGPRPLVHVGRSPFALQTHALPARAVGAGFVDSSRGVAYGTHGDALWLTSDGGARWTAIAPQISGSPRGLALDEWSAARIQTVAQCGLDRCRLGRRVAASWARTDVSTISRAGDALPDLSLGWDDNAVHHLAPYIDRAALCAHSDNTLSSATPSVQHERSFVLLPGLAMRCDTTRRPWSCAFVGDRVAAMDLPQNQRFELALPPARGGDEMAEQEGFRLVSAGVGGVVLHRNGNGRPQHVFITRRLSVGWIEAPDESDLGLAQTGARVVANDQQPWLVIGESAYVGYRADEGHGRNIVIVEHDARGAIARASAPLPTGSLAMGWLARGPLGVGWLAPSLVTGEDLFWPIDQRRPTRLASFRARPLGFCTGAAPSDGVHVFVREPLLTEGEGWYGGSELLASITVANGAGCVRELSLSPWQTLADDASRAQRWRWADGAVVHERQRADRPLESDRCPR
jgi:hypothetical protein